MSVDVWYDRAFIRVENRYIPMIQRGCNNVKERLENGRVALFKEWEVLNFECQNKLLFSVGELRKMAESATVFARDGLIHKRRCGNWFSNEGIYNWIMDGMKTAHTIEEYAMFGNIMYIESGGDLFIEGKNGKRSYVDTRRQHYFNTGKQFLELLAKLHGEERLKFLFSDKRKVYRPLSGMTHEKQANVDQNPYWGELFDTVAPGGVQ